MIIALGGDDAPKLKTSFEKFLPYKERKRKMIDIDMKTHYIIWFHCCG